MQLQPTTDSLVKGAAKTAVMAAMETGNHKRARTVIRELAEFFPEYAQALRLDAIAAYGIAL